MAARFVSIWFRHLTTDWFTIRHPALAKEPFVLRTSSHGRMIITSANAIALSKGVTVGMVLADARAIIPDLKVYDEIHDLPARLLKRLAEWCIRFTPVVAIDLPEGIILDATGCSHLWGGDGAYLACIISKLKLRGYDVRAAIADTPGVAWAVARFGRGSLVVETGKQVEALIPLPPEALRLEEESTARLHKLGLHQIGQFISMPRSSLRRRFGPAFLFQLDRAIGNEVEMIEPVQQPEPYHERLPCLEPISTAGGIQIALEELLKQLCLRLKQEQKGLRQAQFKGYRVDGKIEQIEIGTHRPTHHVRHLFKLFELKLQNIEPALGIELFVLEATKVEDHLSQQEKMWQDCGGLDDMRLAELMDRLGARKGVMSIRRYLPAEHYWPERSLKVATLNEKPATEWRRDQQRPLHLLRVPERIEVTAPIPDYPPMLFRRKGKVHKILKADGPERIEQEWWIQQGQHRDYYRVEDEDGNRYWLFRSGHYHDQQTQWFLHGWFS